MLRLRLLARSEKLRAELAAKADDEEKNEDAHLRVCNQLKQVCNLSRILVFGFVRLANRQVSFVTVFCLCLQLQKDFEAERLAKAKLATELETLKVRSLSFSRNFKLLFAEESIYLSGQRS